MWQLQLDIDARRIPCYPNIVAIATIFHLFAKELLLHGKTKKDLEPKIHPIKDDGFLPAAL